MLSIRKIEPSDAHLINQYWRETTEADLKRMGELSRPDPEENIEFLRAFCSGKFDPKTAVEDLRIWCVDKRPIGYSTLKSIRYGIDGQIHLHMWDKENRRKGYGAALFCMSALEFIDTFKLKDLYCQPKADNPMPNGMLRKIGFPYLGTVEVKRKDGSISLESKFHILPAIASKCIALTLRQE